MLPSTAPRHRNRQKETEATISQWKKDSLKDVFQFAFWLQPKKEEEWCQLELEGFRLYMTDIGHGSIMSVGEGEGEQVIAYRVVTSVLGPPPPPPPERRAWVQSLQKAAKDYLQRCYYAFTRQEAGSRAQQSQNAGFFFPRVDYLAGTRYTLRNGNAIAHVYESQDAISVFLLWIGDLLAEPGAIAKIQECPCGNLFYKVRGQQYCNKTCTLNAHPAQERVKEFRARKAKWKEAENNLRALLIDIEAIKQKQKLKHPRPERQILEEAEKSFKVAKKAFGVAYPRKKGTRYKDEETFLLQAGELISRFHKRVKGY